MCTLQRPRREKGTLPLLRHSSALLCYHPPCLYRCSESWTSHPVCQTNLGAKERKSESKKEREKGEVGGRSQDKRWHALL